ncbi:tripartite tricarboxylate transporter substrate binding protein [Bordetella sp. N]|uniref:tripartite tricarboxylate transporter substrate binding protein n=1 Tax=Bordetella sp. N TaxID=1746199 RepID=UPI00070DC260|nr:tripartite tricarboxylate transporter substrate binding protein [Bordetella sp. N]ALM83540.1 hypothetical protein ASB57_11685 [Bordetella sp. N]
MKTVIACALMAFAAVAHAAYPEQPITVVVPFPAGAGTDLTARTIAMCMETKIPNARFIVLNKPGAAGDIAMGYLAHAQNDGYTIGIVNTPGVVSLPIERKRNYSIDSFDFIANLVEDPGTISVRSDSPIKTVSDLIAASKEHPDSITVGTQGVGSAGHISTLLLEQAAGIKVMPVPFQGASPASVALLGKVIDSSMANLGEAMTFAKGNPWRIVGVMSDQRSPDAPDIPTFKESGFNVISGSMRGLAAPRGIPAAAMTTLADAVDKCNQDPAYLQKAKSTFQPLRYIKHDEYVKALKDLDGQLRKLWAAQPWTV